MRRRACLLQVPIVKSFASGESSAAGEASRGAEDVQLISLADEMLGDDLGHSKMCFVNLQELGASNQPGLVTVTVHKREVCSTGFEWLPRSRKVG